MRYEIPVLLMTSIIGGMRPDFRFSSATINRNIRSSLHRDCHNHAGSTNLVLPMTRFEGGEIFVEQLSGESRMPPSNIPGVLRPLFSQEFQCPVGFHPRLWHCTVPRSGTRVVLVGYHIRNPECLSHNHVLQLTQMGFRLLV